MGFAERLTEIRKKRGLSQEEVAKRLGTHGPAIGRYERGVAKPTIEVASKLAKILGVSLDYLVGNTDSELDADTMKRIQEVDKLPEDDKKMVYSFLDAFIDKVKIKSILLL
ncbi:MAG: helix-turn-helix domain-containing protein [bacterium]